MGIMDKVTGMMGGSSNSVSGIFLSLLNQFGGISGLLQKFQQNGLGHIAQSWVGDQQKLPIEPEQLRSTFGNENIDRISESSGLPSHQILLHLSQFLPGMVSKLTPGGKIPEGNITEDQLNQTGVGEMMSDFMKRKAG